jgi:Fe-S cluster assembly protein SufD
MHGIAQRVLRDFDEFAARLAPTPVAAQRRRALIERALAPGLPGPRDENWKYAQLRGLERASFVPVVTTLDAADLQRAAQLLPQALPGFERAVFIDGRFAPTLSTPGLRAAPAVFDAPERAEDSTADARFAALNRALARDALELNVRTQDCRIEAVFIALESAARAASHPQLQLALAPGSRLTIVEWHLSSSDATTFTNHFASIQIGAGARCQHLRIQAQAAHAEYLDTVEATLQADARYALTALALGARASRTSMRIALDGAGAEFDLRVAALAEHAQVHDAHALVEHRAARTRTREQYRGIAAGRARIAFNGHMIVRAGATGSQSSQVLRSLLAGPAAEANLRPQLEIYTDDVQASHGATTGKLDEQMLFYLLSRGIGRETAEGMLKWAFIADLAGGIEPATLRTAVEGLLAQRLRSVIDVEAPQ